MGDLIALDTCAVISYYSQIFNSPSTISPKSLSLITKVFNSTLKGIVPSVVFVEIYQLYFKNKEMSQKIVYEVFSPIKESANFEIRSFDKDALLKFITLNNMDEEDRFDNHDKQILSSAMVMNCPLITSDQKIRRYNDKKKVIPYILD